MIPRPILLGIVGDSGAGKTTLTRGLVRILGETRVSHISADHYHRYSRAERAARGITALHPDANHLDILEQHLVHLRAGEPVLKPVYRHRDGTFGAPEYVAPAPFTIVEGMLAFHTAAMREAFDVRIYMEPPEDLRRLWKVQRDCSRRGYTTDQVLAELDRREADAEAFIRPQRRHADIVISFDPGAGPAPEELDVRLTLRPSLAHPDLLPTDDAAEDAIAVHRHGEDRVVSIPGRIGPERSAAFEERVWDRLHFATHLRSDRLGEFTIGTELHRSEPLALAQLIVLELLVTAQAAVALGAEGARADQPPARTCSSSRSTTGRDGPTAERSTYQELTGGPS